MVSMNFGVIICCHNGANYIQSQLESIIRQTVEPNKIFVFDWASTDDTVKLVAKILTGKWSKRTCLIKMTIAPGPGRSFLEAFRYISSKEKSCDYFFISDQDDFWLPTKIEDVFKELCVGDFDAIFHDVTLADEHLKELNQEFYRAPFYKKPVQLDSTVLLLNPVIGMTLCVSSKILKEFSDSHFKLFFNLHDWPLAIFIHFNNYKLRFLNKKLVIYRQHANNILGGKHKIPNISKISNHFQKVSSQLLAYRNNLSFVPQRNLALLWIIFRSRNMTLFLKFAWIFLILFNFRNFGISDGKR